MKEEFDKKEKALQTDLQTLQVKYNNLKKEKDEVGQDLL